MSDMIFYTEANFQGESFTLSSRDTINLFLVKTWNYRSAKLNGNKLFTTVTFETYDPVGTEEMYFNEDITDFTTIIGDTANVLKINAINLLSNDIIVSMESTTAFAGYCSQGDAWAPVTTNNTGVCYDQFSTETIPGTMAIMNPDSLTTLKMTLSSYTRPIRLAEKLTNTTVGLDTPLTLNYDSVDKSLSVDFTSDVITLSVDKFDDYHFMVRFRFQPKGDIHVCYYPGDEYREAIDIQLENTLAELRDADGNFIYNSAKLIHDVNYPFYWAQTTYNPGDANYDFSTYKSQVITDGVPNLGAIFDSTTSNAVRSIVSANVIPVFLRLTNITNPNDWKGFVIESEFATSMLVESSQPTVYTTFCSNNPARTQPGMMCVTSYEDQRQDYRICVLRYGSLDETDSTATWKGTTSVNIEYASTDTLTLSLGSDAPADWVITAVTRGDDCWYVDLSGSVPA
ncbi:hypothetical protein CU079_02365 [Citrobacter freundii]|nr:hypothetical protein CU079_02365 [Citrobacter freundii]